MSQQHHARRFSAYLLYQRQRSKERLSFSTFLFANLASLSPSPFTIIVTGTENTFQDGNSFQAGQERLLFFYHERDFEEEKLRKLCPLFVLSFSSGEIDRWNDILVSLEVPLSLKNEFRYLSSQLVDESRARNSSSSFIVYLIIRIVIKLTF